MLQMQDMFNWNCIEPDIFEKKPIKTRIKAKIQQIITYNGENNRKKRIFIEYLIKWIYSIYRRNKMEVCLC